MTNAPPTRYASTARCRSIVNSQELLVDAVRALRGNVTAYDGAYVALAPLLRCPLLTADRRLSRAVESIRVSVEIIS